MVDTCMEGGMNYFDTAYVYHSGKSEGIAKEVLVSRYPRENFYLATKLPAWELKGPEDRDRIFREQLTRCGVEYFDFYLLHSVEDEENYEIYEKYDCFRWTLKRKSRTDPALWVFLSRNARPAGADSGQISGGGVRSDSVKLYGLGQSQSTVRKAV